jgi:hypothetical protein
MLSLEILYYMENRSQDKNRTINETVYLGINEKKEYYYGYETNNLYKSGIKASDDQQYGPYTKGDILEIAKKRDNLTNCSEKNWYLLWCALYDEVLTNVR